MKKQQKPYWLFIQDIRDCMKRIQLYTENLDLESFEKNQLIIDATLRNFTILGEATANIPEAVQEKYPEIPWRKMYALRNMVTHGYFAVRNEQIWEIVTTNLPENKKTNRTHTPA